ncbi:MAG TPA: VOC family protein [Solirubrobacteraceae bacterium]|nr:VOC family protein [Solirubrobacteraceae bacterium]
MGDAEAGVGDAAAGVGDAAAGVRLRQAVLVARELEPLAEELRERLALREPFRDPGVKEFGLENVVFALDDCFLEVVSPTQPGTAGGRYLERHGDGGYMVLFDVRELAAARERAAALGIRVVWRVDLADISGTHLHPGDIGGAIVSIDRSEPEGTWRWGGPEWTGRKGQGAPLRLAAVTLAVADPDSVAARWAHVLGVAEPAAGEEPVLALDGSEVRFTSSASEGRYGLVEIALAPTPNPPAKADSFTLGGVRFRLLEGDR